MTTITTIPEYPVPKRIMRVKFTTVNSGADYVRAWFTDAPLGTPERTAIEDGGLGRLLFHEGDNGSSREFSPEKGGIYRIVTQEYSLLSGSHGGSYESDPNAASTETKVGAENNETLIVGQRMTSEVGAGQDLATLVLYVFNGHFRYTNLADHGETTPSIVNPSTPRAAMAIATDSVRTKLVGLADMTVDAAIGNVTTRLQAIHENLNAHLTQATRHYVDDDDNAMDDGFASAPNADAVAKVVNAALNTIRRHYLNDNGQGPGTAGTDPGAGDFTPNPYHSGFDYTNLPLFESVSGVAEAYRAIADIWRSYEAHRVSDPLHDNADSTNTLGAISSQLLDLHSAFFTQLAAISPTVPSTQSTGAVQLMTQTGALET
jgi:hypothetical protein